MYVRSTGSKDMLEQTLSTPSMVRRYFRRNERAPETMERGMDIEDHLESQPLRLGCDELGAIKMMMMIDTMKDCICSEV